MKHSARVVGWRIGPEQERTRKAKAEAERRAEAAEREVQDLRRQIDAGERTRSEAPPGEVAPRDDDGIRDLLR